MSVLLIENNLYNASLAVTISKKQQKRKHEYPTLKNQT